MTKEIDEAEIRKAIGYLRDGGKPESATAVWDLLDAYRDQVAWMKATTVLPGHVFQGFGSSAPVNMDNTVLPEPHPFQRVGPAVGELIEVCVPAPPVPLVDLECEVAMAFEGGTCDKEVTGYLISLEGAELDTCLSHGTKYTSARRPFFKYAT